MVQKLIEIKEALKERDELLLEYERIDKMLKVLLDRGWSQTDIYDEYKGSKIYNKYKEDISAEDKRKLQVIDCTAKKELKRLWGGGILFRGVAKIERIQHRYFKTLLNKINLLGFNPQNPVTFDYEGKDLNEETVEERLKIYAYRIALRTSFYHGTIGKLINEKQIDFDKLHKEIIETEKDITSLIALLEHLTFKKVDSNVKYPLESYLRTSLEESGVHGYSRGYFNFLRYNWFYGLFDQFKKLPKSSHYNFFMIWETLYHLELDDKWISFKQAKELMDIFINIGNSIKDDLIKNFLDSLKKTIVINDLTWSYIIRLLKNLARNGDIPIEDLFVYPDLITFFLSKNLNINQTFDLCIKLSKNFSNYLSTGFYLFRSPSTKVHDYELRNMFQFMENLLKIVLKEKINFVYGIDRGGRLPTILFFRILSQMGLTKTRNVRFYFIHADRAGKVTMYGWGENKLVTQPKELRGKNILLIDEHMQGGVTIKEAVSFLEKIVGENGKVIPAVYSEALDTTDIETPLSPDRLERREQYHVVGKAVPSWYPKKKYSGVEEIQSGGVRALKLGEGANVAREVRKALSKLAPIFVDYLKYRGY